MHVDLSVEVSGLTFSNPIVISSGDITGESRIVKKLIKLRPGAIILKSTSLEKYAFYVASPGFLDRYGEPGSSLNFAPALSYLSPRKLETLVREILPLSRENDVIIIGSAHDHLHKAENWVKIADLLNSLEVDAIELDIWIPPREKPTFEEQLKYEKEIMEQIICEVKRVVGKPLSVKTAEHHYYTLKSHATIINEQRPGIWHVQGQYPMPVVDVDQGELLFPPVGGWGRNQRGVGVFVTLHAGTMTELPIISSGGVYNWRTAIERMMVGASLVGVYSEIVYRGYDVVSELKNGLESFVATRGYSSIREIIGKAKHCANPDWIDKWFAKHLVPLESVKIYIEEDKCIGCGRCAKCVYDPIYMDTVKRKAVLVPELCVRCGRCVSMCPTNAIKIVLPQ